MEIKTEKEQQFMLIIEDNRQLIYKVCYMYATDDDHFNDLYQEVLIHIWQGLDSFRGSSQWLDEKSYDEISEITGLNRNNVASRLRRIKMKLQQFSEE